MKRGSLELPEPLPTPKDHERAVMKWFILKGDPKLKAAAAEILRLAELADKYWELIYAVATKHPDESRHETALRYIRERERQPTLAEAQCVAAAPTGSGDAK